MAVVEDVFDGLPVLSTARLRLRQITEDDAAALFEVFSDAEVCEFYGWDTFADPARGVELAARTVEAYGLGQAMRWGLVRPGEDRLIGSCGFTRWDRPNRYAVLGYDLARPYWRRGLASEAVAAVVRFGFERMNLHRVEATVLAGNTASAAVLVRAGFWQEGHLVERHWHRGAWHDVQMYGLTQPRWAAAGRPPGPRRTLQ